MIITRTPFRVSFFGGGTDIKSYYSKRSGKVLSVTIDKYIYVVVKKKIGIVEHKYRINWSTVEFKNKISDIENPIARECLRYFKIDYPIEITTFADIPANTGLGSSSAFAVGLVSALFALEGKQVSKYQIAQVASYVEINMVGRKIGKQDHFASTYGNINVFEFNKDESVKIIPITCKKENLNLLEKSLILVYTKLKRNAEKILQKQFYANNQQFRYLDLIKSNVDTAISLLYEKKFNPKNFGNLLHKSWKEKININKKVTNSVINKSYKRALSSGAYGGKLLGAGNGGFLLFIGGEKLIKNKKINNLSILDFKFDYAGNRITYFDRS